MLAAICTIEPFDKRGEKFIQLCISEINLAVTFCHRPPGSLSLQLDFKLKKKVNKRNKRMLVWANIVMITMILIHDADHFRQALCWNYAIPFSVKLINVLVYAPGFIALYLAARGKRFAAVATSLNGLFISTAFASVHLAGASILPYWGVWNKSFFLLGVDTISWTILLTTVAVGVGTAMVGSFVAGRSSSRN